MNLKEIDNGGWPFLAVAPASAAASIAITNFGVSPISGYLAKVLFLPTGVITIDPANFHLLEIVNGGQAGTGTTTVMANRTWATGNPSAANTPENLVNSATPANLAVTAGDTIRYRTTLTGAKTLPASTLVVYIVPR